MLLYKRNWVQDENTYHFKGSEGKDITVKKNISYHELMRVMYRILQLDPIELCITFQKTSVIELCYHQKVGNQEENQEMRDFVQVEKLRAHNVVVDMVIMNIIKKTCKRLIPLHPINEHTCVNIVESNISIQEFSLLLVY